MSESGLELQGEKSEIKTGVLRIKKEKRKEAYRGGTGVKG